MASAPMRDRPRLSVHVFRRFVEGRPEEEHWELIDGVGFRTAAWPISSLALAARLLHGPGSRSCRRTNGRARACGHEPTERKNCY